MNFHRFFLTFIAATMAGLTISPAISAIDGTLGSTSTGHVLINMSTHNLIQISNLSDVILRRNPAGDFIGGTDACIYKNDSGPYSLTAYGSGGNGKFSIDNGQSHTLKYHARFDDGTGSIDLSPGLTLNGRLNANTRSTRCANGDNASITIQIDSHEIDQSPAGNYIGGLTLIVSPE